MTRKEIIARDYELRRVIRCDSDTLRVFAHKGMRELPEDLIEYYEGRWWYSVGGWHCGNPDFGKWDAFVVTQTTSSCRNVYVCGILVRPFTDDERREYEATFADKFGITKRLLAFYDNRAER